MWGETSAKSGEGVADIFTAIAKRLPLTAPPSTRPGAARGAVPAGRAAGVDLNRRQNSEGQGDACNC